METKGKGGTVIDTDGIYQRRIAAITHAGEIGNVAESAQVEPRGFCHVAAVADDLVGLEAFYVGRLEGIGPVWQLTAVDTHTR